MGDTAGVRKRYQPSLLVRALCTPPLLLLAVLLAWGGSATAGWGRWLAFAGAIAVLTVIGRGWVIRVDDLGDRVRVVNWMHTREVPWSDVERFELDGAVGIRLTDLTSVSVSAFPALSRDVFGIAERRNEAAFRALEATRRQRRRQARTRHDD